ncbi:MAG TPA: D-arabinono-1,4-lactone oxidase [Gemmataceae bacterium]|nr:D-arabinono-1,4-lactone oxidase [Gemmataceae bacterium]
MIVNFGGNVRFTPRQVYVPKTEAEILDILDRHARSKVRVVASLHSWSPLVVSDDAVIDMRHFDGVAIETDADGATWATVGGGCQIKHLLDKLHRLGDVTMPSIGLITEQTIAGAISTATHGSGRHSLSNYIDEVRVAAYDPDTGKAHVFAWNAGPQLQAARCALGCMGVILSVRFRCVPKYDVAETIVACASIDEALAGEAEYPLQQFYLVPHLWSWFAQRRVAMPTPRAKRSFGAKLYRAWWYSNIDVGLHLVIKSLMCVLKSPALMRFFYRRLLSRLIIKNRTVIDESQRMLTMQHALFKHLETEIFVPARHVRAAAAFVQGFLQAFDGGDLSAIAADLERIGMRAELESLRGSFTHHYAVTFRRVLADDALIATSAPLDREGEAPAEPLARDRWSSSAGTETTGSAGASPSHVEVREAWYAISFITYVEPRDAFFAMASFLARTMAVLFQARPHWGKHFPLTHADVERLYPRLYEFCTLCRRVDPHGVFRNEFVERVVFGDAK